MLRGHTFGTSAVSVAVKNGGHWITIERLFESAAAEERINLQRLRLDGGLNGRIVEQCVAALGA